MKKESPEIIIEDCSKEGDCFNCPGRRDKSLCEIWPWNKDSSGKDDKEHEKKKAS